jgi:hypothetical protein
MSRLGEPCQAKSATGSGDGGDGWVRKLARGDTRRTRRDGTVRRAYVGRLRGDDPLPGKRQRVPRRRAMRVCGPEPEMGEDSHLQDRLM